MKEPCHSTVNNKRGRYYRHTNAPEALAILKWLHDNNRERDFVLLITQTGMGRRICETVAIKYPDDFKPDLSYINFRLAKTNEVVEVYVPLQLRRILYSYIESHRKEIYASGGWLFYSFNPMCKKGHIGIKTAYAALREAIAGAGINDSIDAQTKAGRQIHRIGTHSFRRLSTTKLLRQTGGDIRFVTQYRHDVKPDTVFIYDGFEEFKEREPVECETFFNGLMAPQETVTNTVLVEQIVERKFREILKVLTH